MRVKSSDVYRKLWNDVREASSKLDKPTPTALGQVDAAAIPSDANGPKHYLRIIQYLVNTKGYGQSDLQRILEQVAIEDMTGEDNG